MQNRHQRSLIAQYGVQPHPHNSEVAGLIRIAGYKGTHEYQDKVRDTPTHKPVHVHVRVRTKGPHISVTDFQHSPAISPQINARSSPRTSCNTPRSCHRTALPGVRHNFPVKSAKYVPFPDSRIVSPGRCSSINRDICIFLCWSTISLFALLLLCVDYQRTSLRLSQELVVGLRYGVAACRRLQLKSNKVIVREDKLYWAAVDALCIACCSKGK